MKKILQFTIPIIIVLVIIIFIIFKPNNNQNSENTNLSNIETLLPLHVSGIDLENLKTYNLPMIIDFGADECIPCKQMEPVLEEVHVLMNEKAIIQFVDVWKNPNAAEGFPVTVIPTQIFINSDGTPFDVSDKLKKQISGFRKYYNSETKELEYTAHVGGLTKRQMLKILEEMGVDIDG